MTTLRDALDEFLTSMKGDKSPETPICYRKRLRSLLDYLGPDRALETITIRDLDRWKGMLADRTARYENHPNRPPIAGGISRATLQGHIRACRTFFAWIEFRRILEVNPARPLKVPKLANEPRKGIDWADRQRIIEVARPDPRDYALVMFLTFVGCRVGGVAGLRLNDLYLDKKLVALHEKGRGGQNEWRIVPMTTDTARAMRRWLAARPDAPYDQVFLSRQRTRAIGPMTTSSVYQVLERLAARAGVTGQFNPHGFRHGFGRDMTEQGMPLSVTQQLLGHKDVSTTARFYQSFSTAQLQASYERFVRKLEGEPCLTK